MVDSAVHIIVHGQVQGVFFRASAQTRAIDLGLTGWIRNLLNGSVEVHAEGDHNALNSFIEWCGEGPPSAKVSRCDLNWVTPQIMSSFKIL